MGDERFVSESLLLLVLWILIWLKSKRGHAVLPCLVFPATATGESIMVKVPDGFDVCVLGARLEYE